MKRVVAQLIGQSAYIVGHAIHGDLAWLRSVGIDRKEQTLVFDTQVLSAGLTGDMQMKSLEALMERHCEIEPKYQHNGGNDAVYTICVFLSIFNIELGRFRSILLDVTKAKQKVWACVRCAFENPLASEHCEICTAERPQLTDAQQKELDKDKWTCSMCTFLNPQLEGKCQVCNSQRELTAEEKKVRDQQAECEVCFSTVWKKDMVSQACKHHYCAECWTRYAVAQVDRGMVKSIKCMEPSCQRLLSTGEVEACLKTESAIARYRRYSRIQDANDDPSKMWCMTPDCDNVLTFDGRQSKMQCHKCGQQVCFKCKTKWHAGITCEEIRMREEQKFDRIIMNDPRYRRCGRCNI